MNDLTQLVRVEAILQSNVGVVKTIGMITQNLGDISVDSNRECRASCVLCPGETGPYSYDTVKRTNPHCRTNYPEVRCTRRRNEGARCREDGVHSLRDLLLTEERLGWRVSIERCAEWWV